MNPEAAQPPKRTIVTIEIASDDAERLEKAFAEGKLAELGVVDVRRIGADGRRWKAEQSAESQHKPRSR